MVYSSPRIQVLGYDTESDGYSGFDEYLKTIHGKTAPARILGDLLNGKKLLWLDPEPDNNLYGKKVINKSADMGCEIVELPDPSVALDHLKDGSFDLVISHWGGLAKDASGKLHPTAVQLLDGIRKRDIEVPVIIFASPKHGQDNRSKALSLGVFEYTWYFEDLFEAIQRLFKEPKL